MSPACDNSLPHISFTALVQMHLTSLQTPLGALTCAAWFFLTDSFNPGSWRGFFHSRGFPGYLCPGLMGQQNQRQSYFVWWFIVKVSRKQTVFHASCNPFAERPCRDYRSKQAHPFAQISRRAAASIISSQEASQAAVPFPCWRILMGMSRINS